MVWIDMDDDIYDLLEVLCCVNFKLFDQWHAFIGFEITGGGNICFSQYNCGENKNFCNVIVQPMHLEFFNGQLFCEPTQQLTYRWN